MAHTPSTTRTIVPPYSVQGTPFEDRPPGGSVNYDANGNPRPIDPSTADDLVRLGTEILKHLRLITGNNFEDC